MTNLLLALILLFLSGCVSVNPASLLAQCSEACKGQVKDFSCHANGTMNCWCLER